MTTLVRRPRARVAAAAALLVSLAAPFAARAAEGALDPAKAGIPIYPAAKADPAVAKALQDSMKLTAATYRTGDDVAKVAAFYEKQRGFTKMPGADKQGAAFSANCKDEYNAILKQNLQKCTHNVTIQNPWMDMKTGKLMQDTLISIVKQ